MEWVQEFKKVRGSRGLESVERFWESTMETWAINFGNEMAETFAVYVL